MWWGQVGLLDVSFFPYSFAGTNFWMSVTFVLHQKDEEEVDQENERIAVDYRI